MAGLMSLVVNQLPPRGRRMDLALQSRFSFFGQKMHHLLMLCSTTSGVGGSNGSVSDSLDSSSDSSMPCSPDRYRSPDHRTEGVWLTSSGLSFKCEDLELWASTRRACAGRAGREDVVVVFD